ncbi:hypothetical protein FKP32DRAFT_1017737 [Trametes sanguinea]|nr:hypothetical protein FKP32DRAFT_1017737 [Trametes sanguinea]
MMTTAERLKRSLPEALQSQSLCAPYYGLLPCSKLSKIDDLSSRTRESLLAEALEYERTLLSLSALLNASAPVNLLPDDVLVKIFAEARPNRYGRTHRSWTELSLVCRHWFVVIAAAPTLWCDLEVVDSVSQLRTGLVRSMDHEIGVRVTDFGSGGWTRPVLPGLPETLDILTPHAYRLKALELSPIDDSSVSPLLTFLDTCTLPRLRSLEAQFPYDLHPGRRILTLTADRVPSLERVRISHIHVDFASNILAQLKVVDLSTSCDPDKPAMTTLETFCGLVHGLINVEELTLSLPGMRGSSPDAVVALGGKAVLAKLQRLALCSAPDIVRRILETISVPASACVALRCYDPEGDMDIQRFLPHDTTSLPHLALLDTAVITATATEGHSLKAAMKEDLDPEALEFDSLKMEYNLTPYAWAHSLLSPMTMLAGVHRLSKLEHLQVECEPQLVDEAAIWQPVLSRLPLLRTLSIVVKSEWEEDDEDLPLALWIFQALDPNDPQPLSPTGLDQRSEGALLCPELEAVYLHGLWAGTDTLVGSVRRCLDNRRRVLGREYALDDLQIELETYYGDREEYVEQLKRLQETIDEFVGS